MLPYTTQKHGIALAVLVLQIAPWWCMAAGLWGHGLGTDFDQKAVFDYAKETAYDEGKQDGQTRNFQDDKAKRFFDR